MKHNVEIYVQKDGRTAKVLQNRSVRRIFNGSGEVAVITPGKTVRTIEIIEVPENNDGKEGGNRND